MGELIYLISICDIWYNKKKAEEISDLLPLVRFDSFQLICNIQEIWWHINTLQLRHNLHVEIIQKLFQKYRGATPSKAMPVRPLRSLPPDPTGRFSGRHFPDVNPPTGTRKHASKRCVVCTEKNDRSDTKYRCSDCNISLCPAPCFHIYHTPQGQ
jgi:hypothetical protein